MTELDYSIEGLDVITEEWERMIDAAQNLGPAHEKIHERFLKGRREAFLTQGSSQASGKWAPRKRSALLKNRRGLGGRILQDTGRLRKSLTQATHPDHIFTVDGQTVDMGTAVPYATFHQEGTRHMPARPPVDPSDAELDDYAEIMLDHIVEPLEGGGKRGSGGNLPSFFTGEAVGVTLGGD